MRAVLLVVPGILLLIAGLLLAAVLDLGVAWQIIGTVLGAIGVLLLGMSLGVSMQAARAARRDDPTTPEA